MEKNRKKIAIIGAGVSGLSAGIYSLLAGYDVEIYERNASVGGMCTGWYRKGTYIDGCIHWLTESDSGVLNQLWKDIGALDATTKVHHFDIYSEASLGNGVTMNFYTNVKKLRDELYRFARNDNDRRLIRDFVKAIAICKHNCITVRRPIHMWTFMDKIRFIAKAFPVLGVLKKYSKLSITDFANQFESPEIRYLLNNSLVPDGYSLFSLVSTFGGVANHNSGIPIGGSKAFMERVKNRYTSLGGRLTLRADVEKIIVNGDHAEAIQFADGTQVKADYIIAACDTHFVIEHLLEGKFRIPQLDERDKAKDANPTFSMQLISFRTKKDISAIAHNRYIRCEPFEVLGKTYNVIYVKHFGYDPTISTDGYTVVQAILTTDEETFDKLSVMPRSEYVSFKQNMAQQVLDKLYATEGQLYGELELLDVATPLTFTHYVNTYKGTFMTYMLTKNNKQMILRNDALPISNLALASHWLMIPGGVPIAVMQGKFAAQTIIAADKQAS